MISEILRAFSRLFTWLIIVAPWEQAIRVRLGSHVRLLNQGWYLRIPFIDRVYRQSIRRRLVTIPAQTLTTADGKALSVSGAIGYEIVDLMRLYETLHDPNDTIESEISAMVADFVGSRPLAECKPSALQTDVRSKMRLNRYGLNGTEFYVTNFVAVRTYRLITGEMKSWQRSEGIDTTREDMQANTQR